MDVNEIMARIQQTAEGAKRDGEIVDVSFENATDMLAYRAEVTWRGSGPVTETRLGWAGANLADMETWLRAGITARRMQLKDEIAVSPD